MPNDAHERIQIATACCKFSFIRCVTSFVASTFFVLSVVLPFFVANIGWCQEELPTDLSGFETGDLFVVEDDIPLDLDNPFLSRLVYKSQVVSQESFSRYETYSKEVDLKAVKNDPQDFRFWVFRRSGTVVRAEKHRLPEEIATPELNEFWLLHVDMDGETAIVVSKVVPKAWAKSKKLNEPIEFTGFFFGLQSHELFLGMPESVPIFACNRVGWFPTELSSQIGPSHLLLASQGVDMSALDVLRASHSQRLRSSESEFFYQFIGAAKTLEDSPELEDIATLGFVDLFDWSKAIGQVVEVEGNVIRVLSVAIDEKRQAELGVEQLYELNLSLPLDQKINVQGGEVYEHRFPVSVQVNSLPLPPQELKGKRVRVKGFFYRFWNYQSDGSKEAGSRGQPAPLVIGFKPRIVKVNTGQVDFIFTTAAILFMIIVLGAIWILRRSDNNPDNVLNKKKASLPEKIDIEL